MFPVSYLSEQRTRLILAHARPHLRPGERVEQWVRVRQRNSRRAGFAYLTDRGLILHWTGRKDGHAAASWEDIEAWSIETGAARGPILCVEARGERWLMQMPTDTAATTERVREFLMRVARRAVGASVASVDGVGGGFEQVAALDFEVGRRSVQDQTKRVLITILGVAIIVASLVIIPLPGPWSILGVIAGLALLATEYDWAQDLQVWAKERYQRTAKKLRDRTN